MFSFFAWDYQLVPLKCCCTVTQVIKSRLLEAELHLQTLEASRDAAIQQAAEAAASAQQASTEASEHRQQRVQLESEVLGLKAWIRTMQVR
jgi:hypothetical protein